MRKLRPDAAWAALPKEAQRELASELEKRSLADARAWLKKTHGVAMSASALSRFYAWFHVTRRLEDGRALAEQIRHDLQSLGPDAPETDKIEEVCQTAFAVQALKEGDAKLFTSLQARARREDRLKIAELQRRCRELEAELQAARSGAAARPVVPPEQVAANLDKALGRG